MREINIPIRDETIRELKVGEPVTVNVVGIGFVHVATEADLDAGALGQSPAHRVHEVDEREAVHKGGVVRVA